MSESKHARKLRDLGFKPLPPEDATYLKRRSERRNEQLGLNNKLSRLPRNKRRAFEKLLRKPHFICLETYTFATDETGREWIAEGKIDITSLGFKNDEIYRQFATQLPPLEPEKNR